MILKSINNHLSYTGIFTFIVVGMAFRCFEFELSPAAACETFPCFFSACRAGFTSLRLPPGVGDGVLHVTSKALVSDRLYVGAVRPLQDPAFNDCGNSTSAKLDDTGTTDERLAMLANVGQSAEPEPNLPNAELPPAMDRDAMAEPRPPRAGNAGFSGVSAVGVIGTVSAPRSDGLIRSLTSS